MKLGQGSFGNVYLVESLGVAFDPQEFLTGGLSENNRPYYALKVLQKKQILGQNLTRYAKTERDVMTIAQHPYIVGLKFAFQSRDKLFLVLDYAPGGSMGRALNKLRKFEEAVAKLYLA
jgi:serine/threonine protein kinase